MLDSSGIPFAPNYDARCFGHFSGFGWEMIIPCGRWGIVGQVGVHFAGRVTRQAASAPACPLR